MTKLQSLEDLFPSEDGWDNILNTEISTVDMSLKILELLPSDLASPEMSASEDGTIDWYWRNDHHAAIITIYPSGLIAYFSMTDAGQVKNSFKFGDSIPAELIESLRQFDNTDK